MLLWVSTPQARRTLRDCSQKRSQLLYSRQMQTLFKLQPREIRESGRVPRVNSKNFFLRNLSNKQVLVQNIFDIFMH